MERLFTESEIIEVSLTLFNDLREKVASLRRNFDERKLIELYRTIESLPTEQRIKEWKQAQ